MGAAVSVLDAGSCGCGSVGQRLDTAALDDEDDERTTKAADEGSDDEDEDEDSPHPAVQTQPVTISVPA